jgi:large subunit ribosomal protein L16
MGKGKGEPDHWVAPVKAGRILFELGGIGEGRAKEAFRLAARKLPLKTRIISSELWR